MSTITYKLGGQAIEVITLDFFTCGNEQLVVVQALDGKPFVGGDKWAISTPFATVRMADLTIDDDDDRREEQQLETQLRNGG